MTEFSFEHVFRAPDAASVLAAYFDPDHLATQDEAAGLIERTVIESKEDGARLHTSWRVAAREQLPLFVRPLVAGGRLSYVETMTWRRADDAIDLLILPQVLGGRAQIAAEYKLTKIGEGQVQRRYRGTVSVAVKLVSGRIERAIVERMEQSMPAMAACTQGWLDRTRGG